VTDADMEGFCEQCRNLVSGVYKTSCKTGEGVEDMFRDIAKQLTSSNKYVVNLSHCSKSLFFVLKFNFDFPRKMSIFLGEKLVKMLWFWTF